jgi:DNA mismatch endonuclease (patch repair protein)
MENGGHEEEQIYGRTDHRQKQTKMLILHTTPERSRNMAAIRGKDNATTEKRFMKILRKHRLSGWRRHQKLPGSPDFIYRSAHVAIFVDGCFWHGCPRCYREPKQNVAYWRDKISRNIARDKRTSRQLHRLGWSVLRFWEHSLRNDVAVAKRIDRALAHRGVSFARA